MQPSKTELELELNEMTFFLIAFVTVVKNLEFIHRHKTSRLLSNLAAQCDR